MLSSNRSEPEKIVLIGSSTGGPGHIRKIIESLPDNYPATVVIAQHIDNPYIPSFVRQLQKLSSANVVQVTNDLPLRTGMVYVCAHYSTISYKAKIPTFSLTHEKTGRYNPEIDALFFSAIPLIGHHSLLVLILTGIGDDGAEGCKRLAAGGARCVAESEVSAVVYGMPRQAKLKTENIETQSLDEIIQTIREFGES